MRKAEECTLLPKTGAKNPQGLMFQPNEEIKNFLSPKKELDHLADKSIFWSPWNAKSNSSWILILLILTVGGWSLSNFHFISINLFILQSRICDIIIIISFFGKSVIFL
jgi:hypothetical protein